MEVSRGDGSVIAVEVAGEPDAVPVLLCHGLADSRLSAHPLTQTARELGLRVMAPDRPGTGCTDPRRLHRVADWAQDAELVLDRLQVDSAALLGISAGGPFAAACAVALPGRVRSLTLISPLGQPEWPTHGMAAGERMSLGISRHAPAFGGWFLGRLAALARTNPRLFVAIATSELPDADRRAMDEPAARDAFVTSYTEAFRRGSRGWPRTCVCSASPGVSTSARSRCQPRSITGMPIPRSRSSTPGGMRRRYRARGFMCIPVTGTSRYSAPPVRCSRRSPCSEFPATSGRGARRRRTAAGRDS